MGAVGDGPGNDILESFWSPIQVGLLNRKKWWTRTELANAIVECIEVFCARLRRHSVTHQPANTNFRRLRNQYPPEASRPGRKSNLRSGHLRKPQGCSLCQPLKTGEPWGYMPSFGQAHLAGFLPLQLECYRFCYDMGKIEGWSGLGHCCFGRRFGDTLPCRFGGYCFQHRGDEICARFSQPGWSEFTPGRLQFCGRNPDLRDSYRRELER